jgi:hypothetical protein
MDDLLPADADNEIVLDRRDPEVVGEFVAGVDALGGGCRHAVPQRLAIPKRLAIKTSVTYGVIEGGPDAGFEPDVLGPFRRHRHGLAGDAFKAAALTFGPTMEFLTREA